MKKRNVRMCVVGIGIISLFFLAAGCLTTGGSKMAMNKDGKKGILVVSFGTSFAETREKTIDACEAKIAQTFTEYEVRRAFTSHIIIDILKERDNLIIDKPEEALQKMYDDGFSEVIVQPLHLLTGEEFHEKILKNVGKFKGAFQKLEVGMPILASTHDYEATMEAVQKQLPRLSSGEAVVLMGHGTHHPANAAYSSFQYMLAMNKLPVYVGCVEGYPELGEVISMLKKDRIKKVTLMPFMLVAGDHASNDMASDEEDSWKTVLANEGFEVAVVLKGLGENPAIQDIYVDHVKDAIEGHAHEGHSH